MAEYSKHQQSIIRNYYDNRESIALQKLQESVTELYLAEGKKRQTVWKRIVGHLEKLKISQAEIDNVVAKDSPEMVANIIERVMGRS
ncbi:MAG: hypothetical protein ABGX07_02925 [Pirellulaceae bacterium]|nr:hypothetical protein [Planctomycetaceae bacterium]HIM31116.1 hypothetical protein [Planctomycetota bacterium]